jgi:hypothetical protein
MPASTFPPENVKGTVANWPATIVLLVAGGVTVGCWGLATVTPIGGPTSTATFSVESVTLAEIENDGLPGLE